MGSPRVLVFDSGLGGLTVLAEIVRVRPDAELVYCADDAVFPYGTLDASTLVARVMTVLASLIARYRPDAVTIACNTASTLVLTPLRRAFPAMPFVGTVPAIKPAAAMSTSGMISVLATPATVARDYTHDLIRTHAAHCSVTLVGAPDLAQLAEADMAGRPPDDAAVLANMEPCFVRHEDRRTDTVVLACTHYPLLLPALQRLAPWPVRWIDPAPAIARRVAAVLPAPLTKAVDAPAGLALFTSGRAPTATLAQALSARGLATIRKIDI